MSLSRRRFLAAATAAAAAAALPRRARAIGPASALRIGALSFGSGGSGGGGGGGVSAALRASGLERLGWELKFRTSIEVASDSPVTVTLNSDKLFETPFLYLAAERRFAQPSARELEVLRRHLTFGGVLLIDSAEGRAGGEVDGAVRQLVTLLFPAPNAGLVPVPADHVILKSFYLTRSVPGRVAAAPALEAVFTGTGAGAGGMAVGGRAAIIYSQNDLGGAWARDAFGNWAYQCYPDGEVQREHAMRLGINLVMYAMCLDYKTDQVHVPFILKRRRWRADEP